MSHHRGSVAVDAAVQLMIVRRSFPRSSSPTTTTIRQQTPAFPYSDHVRSTHISKRFSALSFRLPFLTARSLFPVPQELSEARFRRINHLDQTKDIKFTSNDKPLTYFQVDIKVDSSRNFGRVLWTGMGQNGRASGIVHKTGDTNG